MRLPSYQQLSKEQDKVTGLSLKGNYLVTGPPGTGKTVMALYRASLLQKKKRSVRFIMYSNLLRQYTRSALQQLKLDEDSVLTMHQWIHRYYRSNFHRSPPEIERWRHDWTAIMLDLQNEGVRLETPDVIVDEGQDLPKEFYFFTKLVSQHLTVFADENQRLDPRTNCTISEIRAYASIKDVVELRRNYRNTREIADLAAHFYTGLPSGIPDPPTRSGPMPILRREESLVDEVGFIARYERNNSDLEIGVLLPKQDLVKEFERRLTGATKNPVRRYIRSGYKAEKVEFEEPGIMLLTWNSAKGLEFDTVFLPALDRAWHDPKDPETRMALYVLISRARENLYFSYSGYGEPPVVVALSKDLLQ